MDKKMTIPKRKHGFTTFPEPCLGPSVQGTAEESPNNLIQTSEALGEVGQDELIDIFQTACLLFPNKTTCASEQLLSACVHYN